MSVFSASGKLLSDIKTILTKYSYKFGEQTTRTEIRLTKSSTIKFLEEVKPHSMKHWSKFLIWKDFGFCPLHTSTDERVGVLKGHIPFEELVRISEERSRRPRFI